MKASDLYHTGIVVDDVEAAKARLTAVAGYRWGPTVGGDIAIVTPEGERTVTMVIAYTVDEPRLELVGSIPDTIWSTASSGVHHLGYWSDDVDADAAALVAQGLAVEATALASEGAPTWTYCRATDGTRIELVSRSIKEILEKHVFVPSGG